MGIFRKRFLAAAVSLFTAGFVAVTPVMAATVTCTQGAACSPAATPVTATVSSAFSFTVTINELLPVAGSTTGATTIGPVATTMNFGALASQGPFDPDGAGPLPSQPRSMSSTRAYQVFFGINAQQRPFTISQSSSQPLQNGTGGVIPANAFVVIPLQGVGGDPTVPLPSGITVQPTNSAIGIRTLFTRATTGSSNTMAAVYAITDDIADPANTFPIAPIPLDQPGGTYSTNITFTAVIS